MLPNYEKTQDGVITQIICKPYNYSLEYSDSRYSVFNDRGNILNLRLGYIIGSIGHIPKSLMDVGYGNGDFLDCCKNSIKELYGNDIEPAYPLKDNIKFVKDITSVEAEVITFFDSLEHFPDIEFVKDLKCKYAVISLPWCLAGDDDEWFSNWKHRKPDEHLHHFDEKSLQLFMNRMGYDMINFTNIEDKVRIDKNYTPNILTGTFKKR
jgi:hypothetical protein|tara:strand:+ start:465 stop:1091 length:627 start_codon:yes stop_codon:yes gene_type:complete